MSDLSLTIGFFKTFWFSLVVSGLFQGPGSAEKKHGPQNNTYPGCLDSLLLLECSKCVEMRPGYQRWFNVNSGNV